MMFVSRFHVDEARQHEWLACLWQGAVPSSMVVRSWLYLPGEPRRVLLIWEGDVEAQRWVERAFGDFGELHTDEVADATPGMVLAVNRDLDGFANWLRSQDVVDMTPAEQGRQIDLRRRGRDASSQDEAMDAARRWFVEASAASEE